MNCTIPYDFYFANLRRVLRMQCPPDVDRAYVQDLQLQAIDRIERNLRNGLVRAGLSPEAASSSALEFLRQSAERILGDEFAA